MPQHEMLEVVGLGIVSIWADDLFWLVIGVVRHNFPKFAHKWLGAMGKKETKAHVDFHSDLEGTNG
jgi:hypothetical protein